MRRVLHCYVEAASREAGRAVGVIATRTGAHTGTGDARDLSAARLFLHAYANEVY